MFKATLTSDTVFFMQMSKNWIAHSVDTELDIQITLLLLHINDSYQII